MESNASVTVAIPAGQSDTGEARTASAKRICYRTFRFYVYDWLVLIGFLVLFGGLSLIEPFHRFVGRTMVDDLMYPLKPNTVPFQAVPVIAILLPLLVFLFFFVARRDLIDLHHATLGLLFAVAITGVVTETMKLAIGRPRPNFFWRCFPDGNAVYGNGTREVLCTGDSGVIKEGYKSFPSGHTSWSFAGMAYLSLYLAGKTKLYDGRGCLSKLVLVLSPLTIALLIGLSRVSDYWHHWNDVFAGASIGLAIAALSYHHFFPSLMLTKCDKAHNYHISLTEYEENNTREA